MMNISRTEAHSHGDRHLGHVDSHGDSTWGMQDKFKFYQ